MLFLGPVLIHNRYSGPFAYKYMDTSPNLRSAAAAADWATIELCRDCDELWAQFRNLHDDLLKLVQRKFAEGRIKVLLDAEIQQLGDERHRAKERILLH